MSTERVSKPVEFPRADTLMGFTPAAPGWIMTEGAEIPWTVNVFPLMGWQTWQDVYGESEIIPVSDFSAEHWTDSYSVPSVYFCPELFKVVQRRFVTISTAELDLHLAEVKF